MIEPITIRSGAESVNTREEAEARARADHAASRPRHPSRVTRFASNVNTKKEIDNTLEATKIRGIATELRPMREAFLLAPVRGNDGESLVKAHKALQNALLDSFGGFTSSDVQGAWRDAETGVVYHDVSKRYVVASEATGADRAKLESCARQFGADAKQLAMYVCHANGEIVFLDTREPIKAKREAKAAA